MKATYKQLCLSVCLPGGLVLSWHAGLTVCPLHPEALNIEGAQLNEVGSLGLMTLLNEVFLDLLEL